ncbi:hypothetical protein L0222_32270 [bacterium]|nr:hypothetical protein [bacterium]
MSSVPVQLWKQLRPVQTPMYVLGLLLIFSGLFHVLVWALSGESLEGPISWRKPILFGISGGLTTVSLGWVMGLLPERKSLLALSWIYTISMFVEVGLITMQKWRGVASHFNNTTSLDTAIFRLMGILIMIVAVIISIMTVWSFKDLNAKPEMALGVRAGLVFLNISNLLGMILVGYGSYTIQASPGDAPNIFGQAGMMKVPHALALHAIQVLPILAWILDHTPRERQSKMRVMKIALAGYIGLQIFTLLQTFTGRAPQDVTLISAVLAIVSAIVLAAAFLLALANKENGGASIQPQEVR